MQVDVAVGDPDVPPERHRVEPAAPVGELHALGPGGGAGGVVDGDGRVLVGHPEAGARVAALEQPGVARRAQDDPVLDRDRAQGLLQLGIDEGHGRARMLDDVADLLRVEPEVHRHQDAAEHAHPEEAHQEARRVRRDDRDPLALAHPQLVEGDGQAPAHRGEPSVGDAAEPAAGRIGLVDDGFTLAVDQLGAVEEIGQGQGNDHVGLLCAVRESAETGGDVKCLPPGRPARPRWPRCRCTRAARRSAPRSRSRPAPA